MQGLTTEEVRERISKGQVNITGNEKQGKSLKQIILSNVVTFFNILNVAFFVCILLVGSIKNGLFILVAVINSAIGIFQEWRAQKTLNELQILTMPYAIVLRDGVGKKVSISNLVLDDVLILRAGDQIPADAKVLQGEIECNEAMITGESDNLPKRRDDMVYSGAFVTSGKAYARVIHVGKDNYVETISGEAKKEKKVNSQLRNSINRILKIVSYFIIPLSIGLFAKMFFLKDLSFREAVEQMVSSGVGMIPEGLVLLTSMALTLGVIRLARKRTLVQELYCIETLARVDVLCLDKTGTLTEGKIQVEDVFPMEDREEMIDGIQQILSAQNSFNATSEGLIDYFGKADNPWEVNTIIPFSSERKFSGASFKGHGTYYMGAVQFLFPTNTELIRQVNGYAEKGLRVLVIAKSETVMTNYTIPINLKPMGYITMSDVIRKDCKETLGYFKEEGVAVKIISGDDPLTVSKIAEKCGVTDADRFVDASTLRTADDIREAVKRYTVFGRVKPEQKKEMVKALQDDGHVVAMTGDGVNDVLALKQADCSIAMASGSEATKHTANIVLLDSNFSSMPDILKEGRRVINNICRSASMYLIKTTFSVLLALSTILLGQYYPFQAVQLVTISACAVGIPTFLLQLEPSFEKVGNDFMKKVFRNALPAGISIALFCFMITNIGLSIDSELLNMMQTMSVISIGWIYFYTLIQIVSPLNAYRRTIVYAMALLCIIIMIFFQNLLDLSGTIATGGVLILLGVTAFTPLLVDLLQTIYDKWIGNFIQRMAEKGQEKDKKKIKNKNNEK